MYAIIFDIEAKLPSDSNAEESIRSVLSKHGFNLQQSGVYFGNDKVDATDCVFAVQKLTQAYPWFASSVRDIRMLRVEENSDLRPAIDKALDIIRINKM